MKKNKKFIRNIIVAVVILIIVVIILNVANNYLRDDLAGRTNLIINNVNKTKTLKKDVLIENGIVYLSLEDITNFFDYETYHEQQYNKIVTSGETKIAELSFDKNSMKINDTEVDIKGSVIKREDTIYIPFSEMSEVYGIQINYIEKTDILVVDYLNKALVKAEVDKKVSIKNKVKGLSRTNENIKQGSHITWISDDENGWSKVRSENGKIGYIKTKNVVNKVVIREDINKEKTDKDISLVWDYYSQYVQAPDRSNTSINGLNVVSPSFFELRDGEANIDDKVGTKGKEYIKWAKNNNYEVWAMFANSKDGVKYKENTATIMKDYNLRKKLINNIVDLAIKYNLDGINVDFENMYKADVDLFSRFIIELYPRLKDSGISLSVDVTAMYGGDDWSYCYDRLAISKNSDYLIFMAYDQYGTSSKEAGTTAGYNWVKTSLDNFAKQEIDMEKVILGVPFYTRKWTEQNGNLNSAVVNMKNIDNVVPGSVEKIWNDTLKQYYVEYKEGSKTIKMWIEDERSIEAKLSLIKDYNLGGAGFWAKDRESESIWKIIEKKLNVK